MDEFEVFEIGFNLVSYFLTLTFFSFLVSRFMFRDWAPLRRAVLCVAMGVVIDWGITLAIEAVIPGRAIMVGYRWPYWPRYVILQLGVPMVVFAWAYWLFRRSWIEKPDMAKIFE